MFSPTPNQQPATSQNNPNYGGLLGPLSQGANGIFGGGAGSGLGGLFGGPGGGSLAGGGSMSTAFSPAFWAALIGMGKNIESSNPRSGLGMGLLGGLAPSGKQILKDPVGMGLPTLFGMPFLTPFTSSKAAQAEKPEWQKLFSLGSNF